MNESLGKKPMSNTSEIQEQSFVSRLQKMEQRVFLYNKFHLPFTIIAIIYLSFHVRASVTFLRDFPSDECITPGGTFGICKSIKSCYPLFNLLIRSNSRPHSTLINFLKKYNCGFDKNEPIVCCPVDNGNAKTTEKHTKYNFLNTSCGWIQSYDRVIGGTPTAFHEFPWMALIGYNTPYGMQYNCGGTLISSRYILTAAHCVTALKNMKPSFVRLGEYNTEISEDCEEEEEECDEDCDDDENEKESEEEEEDEENKEGKEKERKKCFFPAKNFNIEELIPHPKYNKEKLQNDIALIRLAEKVEFMDHIQPICLPLNNDLETVSEVHKAIVLGWGTTELGIKAKILRKVVLPILPLNVCVSVYKKKVPISESQICAGGVKNRDSCSGDSGGPMQVLGTDPLGRRAYIQTGIVSFGPTICGWQGFPGVYTKVAHYVEWIQEHAKE